MVGEPPQGFASLPQTRSVWKHDLGFWELGGVPNDLVNPLPTESEFLTNLAGSHQVPCHSAMFPQFMRQSQYF